MLKLLFTSSDIISIHALREEGDAFTGTSFAGGDNFYPRPPRGGRHSGRHAHRGQLRISIHALREEGDSARTSEIQLFFEFLSTPSARRATSAEAAKNRAWQISIHALREEGDMG